MIYPDEPVVDTKTGIVYKDVIEWISLCNLDREEFYNLYMNKSFRYRYLNQNKLRYPGECLPIDATIEDILTGKAIPIVCLPIPDNEEGGIEKFKDIDVKVSKNTEDIEYLKKENEQLKEEIKALKENRKSKYII